MAALLTVVVCAGLGLAVRLASGPIETSVPQSLLDRVVAEAAPGWRVEAGGAQLDFSSDDGLNGLKLRNVVLSDAEGTEVVTAPVLGLRFALSASLDPREALTIREVALKGASVEITRDAAGAFQLDIGEMSSEGAAKGDPVASLASLGNLDDLPRLRIEDARVQYTDLARGSTWRTENARLTLDPSATGLAGSLALVVDGGIGGAQLEAFHATETGKVTSTLTLQGVRPSRVAELDPILEPLTRIDAPLSGTVEIAADDGGTFQRISAMVTASDGTLHLDTSPTTLNSFAAAFVCDVENAGCDIADLSIDTEKFRGSAHGSLRESGPGTLVAALTVENALGRFGEILANVAKTSAAVTIKTDTGFVTLDRADMDSVMVSGVSDRAMVKAQHMAAAGVLDLNTERLTLSQITGDALVFTDAAGTSQTIAQLSGAATFDTATHQLVVAEWAAADLAASIDGTGLQIADLNGSATVDIAGQRMALGKTTVSGLTIKQAETAPTTIAEASIFGNVDFAAQTLTEGKLLAKDAVLSLPDLYNAPVPVSSLAASLAAAHEEGITRLTLKDAVAQINGLPAKAQGNFAIRADGTALGRIDASLGPVAFANVPRHWPNGVAPGGKRWVAANIKQGTSDSLTISAQFDEARPSKDTLDLRFAFRDTGLTFAPGMPPIQHAKGVGHVTLDRFDLSLSEGSVSAPYAGTLALNGSSFAIADFAPDIPVGQVKLRASGAVQSVLRLLDTEPLGVISPTGFDIARAEGQADVRVLLDLPLADALRVEDVQFDARAKIHEYSLQEPQTKVGVSGDLLLVKATADGLTLQSDARIDGLAARLGYSQGFAKPAKGQPDSVLTLESFLSLGDFARHGLVLDEYVEGLTAMKARIELFRGGVARINADADLTNVTLKADRIGWAKPAGVPTTLKLTGFRNPNGEGRIEALSLRGDGLSADGSIGFDARGQITRADLSRVVLGSAIDMGLVYGRKTNGDVGILLKGTQLDLRRAFAEAIEGDAPPKPQGALSGSEMDVSVQVGRAILRDDLAVFDLRGGIRLQGGALRAANIEGKLNGSADTRLLVERRGGGMAVRLTAPDAGAFVRATDIFSGAYDGTLTLDALTRDTVSPTQISGRIRIDNVVLHDAPTLRKILSGGAIASLMRDLSTGGIGFTKIELPFRGVGPRWQIENGVAFGPALGLTLDGTYDLSNSQLALNGSVSPAYAINGALGNVPLLGKILTGGEGEGVFGVTFSVDGDSNKPVVNVNPLSALAPGFLRQIVAEVSKGGDGQTRDLSRFKAGADN